MTRDEAEEIACEAIIRAMIRAGWGTAEPVRMDGRPDEPVKAGTSIDTDTDTDTEGGQPASPISNE